MQAVQQVSKTTGKNYNAIDLMRMICAILVICVHVYPLTMFGEQANFVLVHAVARIAVPFFCVTSGFFFFKKLKSDPRLRRQKKKTDMPCSILFGGFWYYILFGRCSIFQFKLRILTLWEIHGIGKPTCKRPYITPRICIFGIFQP